MSEEVQAENLASAVFLLWTTHHILPNYGVSAALRILWRESVRATTAEGSLLPSRLDESSENLSLREVCSDHSGAYKRSVPSG